MPRGLFLHLVCQSSGSYLDAQDLAAVSGAAVRTWRAAGAAFLLAQQVQLRAAPGTEPQYVAFTEWEDRPFAVDR